MNTSRSWPLAAKSAFVVLAIISLALALKNFLDLHYIGFPDSHLTDYERALMQPLELVIFGQLICAGCFSLLAVFGRPGEAWRILAALSIAFFIGSVCATEVFLPLYLGSYLQLENGTGG